MNYCRLLLILLIICHLCTAGLLVGLLMSNKNVAVKEAITSVIRILLVFSSGAAALNSCSAGQDSFTSSPSILAQQWRRCHPACSVWRRRTSAVTNSGYFTTGALALESKSCRRAIVIVRAAASPEDPNDMDDGTEKQHENKSDDSIEERRESTIMFEMEDKNLVAGDILALFVVVALLGFNDAVLDPHFLSNGGFAAPITLSPRSSTLGIAFIQLYQIALAWVVSSLYNRGYTHSAVESDQSAVKSSFAIWLTHCSIRIVLALLIALLYHAPVDVLDILKQSWFVLPLMTAFRILYARNNKFY